MLVSAPAIASIIEEGNRDQSLSCSHPQQMAEVLLLLVDVWMSPVLFPGGQDVYAKQLAFFQNILETNGTPILDAVVRAELERVMGLETK